MRKIISIAAVTLLSTSLFANADMQTQIDELTKEVQKLKKDSKRTKKSLSAVKKATGGDNIKFGVDFRNSIDSLSYKFNDDYNYKYKDSNGDIQNGIIPAGSEPKNDSLLTSRLYLTMAAAPMDGLTFRGKLAIYSVWGTHLHVEDPALKDWAASSKAADTVMRVKEAYFVYSNALGEQPISFSIGRRPSSNGFLSNYRENEKEPGSPLAHTVNMEVNAAMVKLDWDRFVGGAYTKLVYGRAHNGAMEEVYGKGGIAPYADKDTEDENVNFALMLGDAYNDGQYQVMYQWAHIFDTKGKDDSGTSPLNGNKSKAAGTADLYSLGLKVDGIGDEISDFLDDTTVFVSAAYTNYNAKDGHILLGSESGGSQSGQSIWLGAIIPDGFTEAGKFGFEYNHGSKYWTPMTWAEDTAMGSKIAVRGDAYEAYWNFNLFGVKYLPSQVRYTYAQHDYTPNINCAGWVAPQAVDITSQDLRLAVSYRY